MATITWLDAVMVLLLVSSIGFGFHQGLLRQIVLLAALYIGTILSAQYYLWGADLILTMISGLSTEIARMIAFILMVVIFTVVVTWLIWTAYRETRLPTVVMLDEVTGAVLGAVLGVFAISLSLILIQYALDAPWPEGNSVKAALHMGMLNSSLQSAFSSPVPLIQATLRPWMPAGTPLGS
jgi:uncharacterized membrane protein required for colicin V production